MIAPRFRRPLRQDNEEQFPVNWRRGMFRVWVLISAAWLMGWIIYFIIEVIETEFREGGKTLVIPVVLLGPPVALLLFGLAARWAFQGFRPDTPPPASHD